MLEARRPSLRLCCLPVVLAAASLAIWQGQARAQLSPEEREELKRLERDSPAAVEVMKQGEAAFRAQQLVKASELFARARQLATGHPVPARRHCETLIALGRKEDAMTVCTLARAIGGTAADMRAMVGAYLAGPGAPSSEEIAYAQAHVDQAFSRDSDPRHGYAAQCALAQKLGDRRMLRTCREGLLRVAPEHEDTKLILAATAASTTTPLRTWVALALVALVSLGTAAHALGRVIRARVPQRRQQAASITLLLLGLLAMPVDAMAATAPAAPPAAPEAAAAAQERGSLTTLPIDEEDPEASVPGPDKAKANPIEFGYMIQDFLTRAEAATKEGNHARAVRYYRAVIKAVPDRAIGLARLCESYEKLGDRERAIKACGIALGLEGVRLEDHARYVRLVLGKPGPVADKDREYLLEVLTHLRQQPEGALPADHLAVRARPARSGPQAAGDLHGGAGGQGAQGSQDGLVPVGAGHRQGRPRGGRAADRQGQDRGRVSRGDPPDGERDRQPPGRHEALEAGRVRAVAGGHGRGGRRAGGPAAATADRPPAGLTATLP